MNFRQRIAWLFVVFFLIGTCALVYYIFEISDKFNEYALDHINTYHKVVLEEKQVDTDESKTEAHGMLSMFSHISDVPIGILVFLCFVPYLQVFAMLLACTKPNPQFSVAYLWPIYTYLWCKQKVLGTEERTIDASQSLKTPVSNGRIKTET